MCNRYSNIQEEEHFRAHMKTIIASFKQELSDQRFSFNLVNAFADPVCPVVTMNNPENISWMNWGLMPHWFRRGPDEKKMRQTRENGINARAETIFERKTWKGPIATKRLLIPATGFFEWNLKDGIRYPYLVQVVSADFPDDTTPFCIAGIWDEWKHPVTKQLRQSFAMIITAGGELMKQVHVNPKHPEGGGRQAVIVRPQDYSTWLNPAATFEDLDRIMQPLQDKELRAYTITRNFSGNKFDPTTPDFLQHVYYPEGPTPILNGPEI